MTNRGKLFIVPTPIGNLADVTYRAIDTLQNVDLVLAEDTRKSSILFKKYSITTPIKSYHINNEHKLVNKYVGDLLEGKTLALVSDAGTPSISDPGFLLIRESIKENIEIICLPGATALIPALVTSGLPSDRFVFEGFLPRKKGRKSRLKELAIEKRTVILYESPLRIKKTLEDLKDVFGPDREISFSREISKIYEETYRGTIGDAIVDLRDKRPKGEFVICIDKVH
tara:strand:- start:407 stop:1087 length:681 start_codon:yes stop_codon:yes gene_type:complete